jgi:hypothetical protein
MGFLVVIGVIVVVGYFFSLRAHPLTKCRICNATGRHFGSVYPYAHRRCRHCGGTGRKDRLGVKLFYGGTGGTGIYPTKK